MSRPPYQWDNFREYEISSAGMALEQKQRWLEKSGPLYADVEVKLHSVTPEGRAVVEYEDGSGDILERTALSYASGLMVDMAEPGSMITLKIRIDEVAAKRKTG